MIRLEKYRDPWLAKGINNYIGFYNREFYCLDNFSAFQVQYEGILYSTVETAYQAQGFIITAPSIAFRIYNARSPLEAKMIAHENLMLKREDWEDVKLKVMEALLRAKLDQHSYVRKKLLETGTYPIVEDSPTDSFWGCGADRLGRNEMGKLWMKIRADIRD